MITYARPIFNMPMYQTMLSSERGQDMHPPLRLSLLGLMHGYQNTIGIQNAFKGLIHRDIVASMPALKIALLNKTFENDLNGQIWLTVSAGSKICP